MTAARTSSAPSARPAYQDPGTSSDDPEYCRGSVGIAGVVAVSVVNRRADRGAAGPVSGRRRRRLPGQLRRLHCWLAWPLQSQMMTAVPLVVPRPLASRHLLPYTISWRLVV